MEPEEDPEEIEALKAANAELKTRRDEISARADALSIDTEVMAAAARLKFADPSDAVALLDKSKFEVSEDGSVKGIESALRKLLKDKPHLAKRAPHIGFTNPSFAAGNGSGETGEQRRIRLGLR